MGASSRLTSSAFSRTGRYLNVAYSAHGASPIAACMRRAPWDRRAIATILHAPQRHLTSVPPSVAHFAGTRKLAFAIRSSKIQGKGAFATRRIKKDERIIEYLGECIDEAESDIRYPDDEMGRHHTFLFSIGDGTRVLDAGPIEWPAKYINHSCDPNCEAIEEEDGRVFISAIRAIEPGTELLYDYAYERTEDHTAEDEKLYVCRCGSPKCRGTIMAPPKVKKDKAAKAKDKQKKKDKKEKKREKAERKARQLQEEAAAVHHAHGGEAHAAKHAATKTAGTKKAGAKKAGAKKGTTKRGTKTAGKQRTRKGTRAAA